MFFVYTSSFCMIKQAKSDPGLDQSNPGCKNVLTMALTRGFK